MKLRVLQVLKQTKNLFQVWKFQEFEVMAFTDRLGCSLETVVEELLDVRGCL